MMSYQKSVAEQIKKCIESYPGLRAKDIGKRLGLSRSTVNSYLYTKRPPALGNEVYQDMNYGWHLTKTVSEKLKPKVGSFESQKFDTIKNSTEPKVNPTPYVSTQLDYHTTVKITLKEAFQGVYKTINYGNENINIFIQPYTRPGTKICVPGKGMYHPSNNQIGNLYCHIELIPDDLMQLSGNDILSQISITNTLAMRGGSVEVQTLDGPIQVQIPPGVKSGDKFKIKHKGWLSQSNIRGDQYIHLEVTEIMTIMPKTPELDTSYSFDIVEEVFRDPDYLELSDNDQSKLIEFLEKARQRQEQQRNLIKYQKPQLLIIITSPSFWIAVAIAGAAIYSGLKLMPQFLAPAPLEPLEQPNDTG